MSEANKTERILFDCGCGTPLKAPTRTAGKRVKCPNCGASVVVPGGPAPQAAAPAAPAEGKATGGFDASALAGLTGGEVLSKPPSSKAAAPSGVPGCPSCKAPLPLGERRCSACGFDLREGRRIEPGGKKKPARDDDQPYDHSQDGTGNRFLMGVGLSVAAAGVAAAVWYTLGHIHFNWAAFWLAIGGAAGWGMRTGYRCQDVPAGLVAAVVAASAIIGAVFMEVRAGFDAAARPPTDVSVTEMRGVVVEHLADEVLLGKDIDPEDASPKQTIAARDEAAAAVRKMSDDQVAAKYQEITAAQEAADAAAAGVPPPGAAAVENVFIGVVVAFRLLFGALPFLGALLIAYRLGAVD